MYVQDLVASGQLTLRKVHTSENLADLMTKHLSVPVLTRLAQLAGMCTSTHVHVAVLHKLCSLRVVPELDSTCGSCDFVAAASTSHTSSAPSFASTSPTSSAASILLMASTTSEYMQVDLPQAEDLSDVEKMFQAERQRDFEKKNPTSAASGAAAAAPVDLFETSPSRKRSHFVLRETSDGRDLKEVTFGSAHLFESTNLMEWLKRIADENYSACEPDFIHELDALRLFCNNLIRNVKLPSTWVDPQNGLPHLVNFMEEQALVVQHLPHSASATLTKGVCNDMNFNIEKFLLGLFRSSSKELDAHPQLDSARSYFTCLTSQQMADLMKSKDRVLKGTPIFHTLNFHEGPLGALMMHLWRQTYKEYDSKTVKEDVEDVFLLQFVPNFNLPLNFGLAVHGDLVGFNRYYMDFTFATLKGHFQMGDLNELKLWKAQMRIKPLRALLEKEYFCDYSILDFEDKRGSAENFRRTNKARSTLR